MYAKLTTQTKLTNAMNYIELSSHMKASITHFVGF